MAEHAVRIPAQLEEIDHLAAGELCRHTDAIQLSWRAFYLSGDPFRILEGPLKFPQLAFLDPDLKRPEFFSWDGHGIIRTITTRASIRASYLDIFDDSPCYEEVVSLANETGIGLAGYFFCRDMLRIYRVAEPLDVSMVGVNTRIISDTASPCRGAKESGFGRERSKYRIDQYLVIKTVTIGGLQANLWSQIRVVLQQTFAIQKSDESLW